MPPISGLDPDELEIIPGGLFVVGGQKGLGMTVTGTSLEVTGSPSVTGASTIQVFGPLLLNLPLVGGGGILDGSVLVLLGRGDATFTEPVCHRLGAGPVSLVMADIDEDGDLDLAAADSCIADRE